MSVRRPVAIVVCAVALLAPTWSCLDATELDLQISTDEPIANIAAPQQAQILVGTPADVLTTPTTNIASNTVDGSGSFGDLVVAPNGDIGADVALRVALGVTVPTSQCTQTPQGCIFASRTIRYVAHHKLVLPVKLESACLGKVCQPGLTCVAGNCVSDTVDPTLCDGGTCGTGSLGDGSVVDDAPAVCNVTNAATCGSDTCVDLSTSPQHCGQCNIDCTGGTCANGTCQITTKIGGQCLGVWGGSVYVVDETAGLYTAPANGGDPTPINLSGGKAFDISTLREGDDLSYSINTQVNGWDVQETKGGQIFTGLPAAERIAMDDNGVGWFSLTGADSGYVPFGGTAAGYGALPVTNLLQGWLSVAAGTLFASLDHKQLCRVALGTLVCRYSTTTPSLTAPAGVAVSDPGAATADVYVVDNFTKIVKLDNSLSNPSDFGTGGVAMVGLTWDKATSTAYAISDGAITKTAGGPMQPVVAAQNVVPRCIAVDDKAVYWLQTSPSLGVFKHYK